jgi:hypothetical protein
MKILGAVWNMLFPFTGFPKGVSAKSISMTNFEILPSTLKTFKFRSSVSNFTEAGQGFVG